MRREECRIFQMQCTYSTSLVEITTVYTRPAMRRGRDGNHERGNHVQMERNELCITLKASLQRSRLDHHFRNAVREIRRIIHYSANQYSRLINE